MEFSPSAETVIRATPVGTSSDRKTRSVRIPCCWRKSICASPNASVPTRPTIQVSASDRAAATAWFAPLPPGCVANSEPKTVSPGLGCLSARQTRSTLMDPTTTTLPMGRSSHDRASGCHATERVWQALSEDAPHGELGDPRPFGRTRDESPGARSGRKGRPRSRWLERWGQRQQLPSSPAAHAIAPSSTPT